MNRTERYHTLSIATIMASRMLGLFMIFPVFSWYAPDYHATPLLAGIAIGIYGLTQAALQIIFGYLSDQYGRRRLVIIGLWLFALGSLVAALSEEIIGIIIGRAIQGAGAISSVLMAWLADNVREAHRIKANAFIGIQIGFVFVLALIIAPPLSFYIGLSGLFWVMMLLSLLSMALSWRLPAGNVHQQYALSWSAFKSILRFDLLRFDLSIFSLHCILSSNFVVLPLILLNQTSINLQNSWQIYLPIILASFVLMLPFIIAATKYQKNNPVFIIAIMILAIIEYLFALNPNYWLILTLLVGFFAMFNTLEAMLPALAVKIAPKAQRGMAMGMFNTAKFLGIFVGGTLGGFFYGFSGITSVFLCSSIIAACWGSFMLITRRYLVTVSH